MCTDNQSTTNVAHRLSALVVLACLVLGCGKAWEMDYGKPAAQFLEDELPRQGQEWVGKKVTVKGIVTRADVSKEGSAWLVLGHGIRCNLGEFRAMVESMNVGDTAYVDGFLRTCEEGDVLIEPAMLRDPTAPFSPEKRSMK